MDEVPCLEGGPMDVKNYVLNGHHGLFFTFHKELTEHKDDPQALSQSVEHLETHFLAEEKFFRERDWDPHLTAMHQNSHLDLVAILATLKVPVSDAVLGLMQELVVNHILTEDLSYSGALTDEPRSYVRSSSRRTAGSASASGPPSDGPSPIR
eukprot:RCo013633